MGREGFEMRVALRVIGQKDFGHEIIITVPRFKIGRGDAMNLRVSSDFVSREHCVIEISEFNVTITDLESTNGTVVNGHQLTEPYLASTGDSLSVGRQYHFQLLIDNIAEPPELQSVVGAFSATPLDGIVSLVGGELIKDTGIPERELGVYGLQEDSENDWLNTKPNTKPEIERSSKKKQRISIPSVQFTSDDSRSAANEILKRFFSQQSVSGSKDESYRLDRILTKINAGLDKQKMMVYCGDHIELFRQHLVNQKNLASLFKNRCNCSILVDCQQSFSEGKVDIHAFNKLLWLKMTKAYCYEFESDRYHPAEISQFLRAAPSSLFVFLNVELLPNKVFRSMRGQGFYDYQHRVLFVGECEYLKSRMHSSL